MSTQDKNKNPNVALNEKLNKLSKEITMLKIGAGAAVLLGIAMMAIFNSFLYIFCFIGFGVLLFFIRKKNAKKKEAAVGIIRSVIQEKIDLTEYSPYKHIPESAILKTNLMPSWDVFSGSDLVQGVYKGVTIAFSDIHLENIETYTDSDGNRQTRRETLFKGQWIVCELPKRIENAVRLRERPRIKLLPQKSSAETENAEFNKKYQILTEDPHTMFYILTPHFMEYILSADLLADGQTYLCFEDNYVYIGIDNRRDAFEMRGKFENVDEIRARIEKEVQYIIDIIDELKQNNYLFGGEN